MQSNFDVRIAYGVEEVGQEAWDCFGQNRPFSSFNWYRYVEAVMSEDVPYYVLLYCQEEPVARATFWLKRQEYLPVSSPTVYRIANAILKRWPLLACRSPFANEPGLILPPPPRRDEALRVITETAREIARQNHASFILFDYLNADEATSVSWPDGFSKFKFSDTSARLDIPWKDFDGYLSSLSKPTRRNYKLHCKHAEELNIHVEPLSKVTDLERALTLIRNLEQKHNSIHEPYARAMLENIQLIDGVWLAAYAGDQLVGCCLELSDGNGTATIKLAGLDYSTEYVYFQLIYGSIRHAIASGASLMKGGSGAYELKRRLGFIIEEHDYLVFRASNPLLRFLVKLMNVA